MNATESPANKARKVYIVFHIPKNAGSTLKMNFKRNFAADCWLPLDPYPNLETNADDYSADAIRAYLARHATPRTKCIFGHAAYYGVHRLLPFESDPVYLTFLRDPVERIISLYYYRKRVPHADHVVPDGLSLERWFETNASTRGLCEGQVRHLLLDPGVAVDWERKLTADDLQEAKRRLRKFWFVGITETFREDAGYLYGKLGFRRFHGNKKANVSAEKKPVSAEFRACIAAHNPLDTELYRFGLELRQDFVRHHWADVAFCRIKAAFMESVYNKWNRLRGRSGPSNDE